jgi:hypothetical protein
MNLTCDNNSVDTEIPSTSDETMPEMEKDGLLLYSEKDVKVRIRKSICKTVGICVFLALVGMSAALIHARDRKPDEAMQIIAEEFHANNGKPATGEEATDGQDGTGNDNNQNRKLYYPSYCYESTMLAYAYDAYDAAYACVDALYYVGCYGGTPYITDYYQYYYGSYWYVECICDC